MKKKQTREKETERERGNERGVEGSCVCVCAFYKLNMISYLVLLAIYILGSILTSVLQFMLVADYSKNKIKSMFGRNLHFVICVYVWNKN